MTRPSAIAIVLCTAALFAQDSYFPKGALSSLDRSDSFRARWYSSQLKVFQEPSLLEAAKDTSRQIYRFTWLRSFHRPVAVRLEVNPDGSGSLTIKMASTTAGHNPAKLVEDQLVSLTRERTQGFLSKVDKLGFWSLASFDNVMGCDGAEWIIEGVRNGKYHVVDRWSPSKGPIHELGMNMAFHLAHLRIPKDEIY